MAKVKSAKRSGRSSSLDYTRPWSAHGSKPPGRIHLLLWEKEREVWYLQTEVERLQREINFLKWATRDLLDVLEDRGFMGGLERNGFFRRKIARLKGVL